MRNTRMCVALTVVLAVLPIAGCSELVTGHVNQLNAQTGMALDIASRLADGGLGQMQVAGQGLEPGLEGYFSQTYIVGAKYRGLSGQFAVAGQGDLGGRAVPPEILRVIQDTTIARERRLEILEAWLKSQNTSPTVDSEDRVAAS